MDIEDLNTVEQVETPLCSASTLKDLEMDIKTDHPESMSLNTNEESLSPILTRSGTQRSYGWKFIPDRLQSTD